MVRYKLIYAISASCVIFYFILYTKSDPTNKKLECGNESNQSNKKIKYQKESRNHFQKRKADVVILLTMMRSGSSIVGSIFNERSNVTYLYEPLYPFGLQGCDNDTRRLMLEVLEKISNCQFENLQPLYNTSARNDKNAKCKTYNLCFASASSKTNKFLSRDIKICSRKPYGNFCPTKPIPSDTLNRFCHQSLLVAMKVIYLCKLEWLVPLLNDSKLHVKVVHLVRDPRSTIYSRTKHSSNISLIRAKIDPVCSRLSVNLMFLDGLERNSKIWNQYMRIRYEDFILNPLGAALKIYKFVGLEMTMKVKEWLDVAFTTANKKSLAKSSPQGLKRNIKSVLNNWRIDLNFETVQEIQAKCDNILKNLGYRIYKSNEELKEISKLYFTPEW